MVLNIANLTKTIKYSDHQIPVEYVIIKYISDIIGYYIITIISVIGVVINSVCLIIMFNETLHKTNKFYVYVIIKTIADLLVCLIGIFYLNADCLICEDTVYNSYVILFLRWYIIRIPTRIIYLASSISEIILILNRYQQKF